MRIIGERVRTDVPGPAKHQPTSSPFLFSSLYPHKEKSVGSNLGVAKTFSLFGGLEERETFLVRYPRNKSRQGWGFALLSLERYR